MKPSIGRIVHYKLSEGDVAAIERTLPTDRTGAETTAELLARPRVQRNPVHAGQVYPAQVTAVFDPSTTTANLVVQLDGTAQYWATSRVEGSEPGQWSWPPRA